MPRVMLASETDFDGWRAAARALAAQGIAPDDVTWQVESRDADLFASAPPAPLPAAAGGGFNVPAAFIELARTALLHRDPERFGLLYRLLWRLRHHPELMRVATDADVIRVQRMAKAIHHDKHKMEAFVRFREVGGAPDNRFVAWFEPAHYIVEAAAPFFARRFADMRWSILTPERCAHWDGAAVTFTPGTDKRAAPSEDRMEDIWRAYYASIFNPARLKVAAMKAEMPQRYWRNLPEARLIKPLIAGAAHRSRDMIAADATAPAKPQRRNESVMKPKPPDAPADSLSTLRAAAAQCRACPLWKDATQTVFGEGPAPAPLMLVGEQPGDKEDLAGKPFVGPAGQMLDRALKDAGIDRRLVYVTNAVKHFKFVPRGKFRLHQKPNTAEIRACRPWYERERATVKPVLVVAMGATAAQGVLGKITPINKTRGRLIDLDDGAQAIVTVHPSYLLRLPDADAKAREYGRFVVDLKVAAARLRKHADAA